MHSETFAKHIPMHAACGLLYNEGIYILGGRYSRDEWLTDNFFFDLKEGELKTKKNLTKGLFGPAMTKPYRTQSGEIIFFVAGGAIDT
jgi:hypothetical protein